ncbi:MAG: lytic transglycosylase, partial [Deltaproteobacteria bacterium]|nr:lytic transglycosylase [Deltaproteobacteria bacterium]
ALGLACALSLGSFSLASAAGAEGLYRYVDARGVVHFTNVPRDGRFKQVQPSRGITRASRSVAREATRSGAPSKVRTYDPVIAHHSHAQGVPPALVKAVIHAESAFDPRAVSHKGAMGLMQLMPDTAQMLGVAQPFRAEDNIEGGIRYLRRLHDRYGSWTYTLAAYNAGPTAVDRYRGVPPYDETRNYVRRVLSFYRRYHGDFTR